MCFLLHWKNVGAGRVRAPDVDVLLTFTSNAVTRFVPWTYFAGAFSGCQNVIPMSCSEMISYHYLNNLDRP